jgi:hypothetical protein
MPTACWHDRYGLLWMLPAFGLLCSFMLVQPQQSCAETAGAGAAAACENMLPGINEISGWQRSGACYTYVPDKLYTYIDGAADQFIAYGFVRLQGAEYVSRADRQESITVDIYDMGSALSAFGMFASKKDSTSATLGIGAESFGNDQFAVFYKGRFYVEIQARISRAGSREVPLNTARMVAAKIPAKNSRPELLGLFPATGKVAGSENYIVGGILGHAFLPRGIASDYRLNGELIKAYIVLFSDAAQAGAAFEGYKKYLTGAGEKIIPRTGFGEKSFAAHEQYQKNILVALIKDAVVCIAGLTGMQNGEQLVQKICSTMQQSAEDRAPSN